MIELDDLEEAIKAGRFNGRIEEIRKAFDVYKKAINSVSTWEKIKVWFKAESVMFTKEQ